VAETADAGQPPAMTRAPTLVVGREREQVFLREELAGTVAGHGRLVLLGGEAGIGKTSLARDLAREASARGARVLTGHCYDLTNTPPYGPWLDLAASYPTDAGLPAPPAAFAGGSLERVTDQAALYAEVRRFLAALCNERPLVVLLEDLHWADPASLELMRHVAPHLRHWPVLLVVTYRVDELTRRHPFSQQLPALVREAEGLRLDLRRLDTEAMRRLVATRYGLPAADETRLVGYLEQHAEGNPFFATELLRALEEEDLLRQAASGWVLERLDRVVVPSLLRQVIDGRVGRLGEHVREPLSIAAVIGQQVPLSLWRELANLDDETLLAIVERAVEAHLLDAERGGTRVRFVHALTREALYDGVLPPRRRLWHERVAEALMASGAPDPDAVAYHLQQAGDTRAGEWLVAAADRAQRAYAWLTAAERLRAATDLLALDDGQDLQRARLLYRLGRLLRFSHPVEALGFLDEADCLAAQLTDPFLAAEILFQRGVLLCYSDQFQSGMAMIAASAEAFEAMPISATRMFARPGAWLADVLTEAASVAMPGDERAVELLHAAGQNFRRVCLPWFQASAGQLEAALASSEQYLTLFTPAAEVNSGVRLATAYAYHGLGIAHASYGAPEEARQAWAQARTSFAEHDHHALSALTLLDELRDVALPYDAANPPVRRRAAAEAEAAIARAGGAFRSGISPRLAWLGSLIVDGQWNEADRILRSLATTGNCYLRREVRTAIATLAHHRGAPDLAAEHIAELFPNGPALEPGDVILQEGLFLQRLAAELCLDASDLPGARAWLAAHDCWLDWSGSILGRADGRLAWARYHLTADDRETAQAFAAAALELAAAPEQPLVRLSAFRFLGEIETASGNLAEAQAALDAALVLAERCEAPFEGALTLLAIAELRLATGAPDEARVALDEVRQICTPLGAAPTLARAAALATRLTTPPSGVIYPAGLTHREVQVVRLLAQRQTDKEIAEALFLGPRTVQSHVSHILNKLGVANRREAATAADRLGLL
jgi:DNA-binding CsgD family transcriptional regulator